MSSTIKRLICLAAAMLFVLCSCGKTETGNDETTFPAHPDKIVVGADGVERVILPDDEEYSVIVSKTEERVKNVGTLGYLLSVDHDPETGEHLSVGIRASEVFVEYVYNEKTVQKISIDGSGGVSYEEKEISRIFFPLTRDYHNCIFVSSDEEYKSSATLGSVTDDTSLIKTVREITAD